MPSRRSQSTQSIRAADVLALLTLTAEVSALPPDLAVRRRHILAGLCRLTGARVGSMGYLPSDGATDITLDSDREWYDVDTRIHAHLPVDDGRALTVTLWRGVGEPSFGPRELRLVDTFIRAAAPLFSPSSPPSERLRQSLSPRLRRVLDELLAGYSEKEVAHRLRLSVHSVHQYAKMIYKQLGACSRSELMAMFIANPTTTPPRRALSPV